MIKMELARIVIAETSEEQVIVLQEVDGKRSFPIVIGSYEAIALDRNIKNIKTPRPLSHDLIENILKGLNISLNRIVVTQLKNNTFYARLVLKNNGREFEIDSRPSDAIILASKLKAPIYVNEQVLEKLTGSVSD